MIHIVDYGLGNIRAFLNVYRRLNIEARTAENADGLRGATHVILPGVGHFDHAMDRLEASGMREPLEELVSDRQVPVLGICVGMQILATSSDEGTRPGLGWIDAHVRAFSGWEPTKSLPMPHMGWNDVVPRGEHALFGKMDGDCRFYFLHSYFFECQQPEDVLAEAEYGAPFACAVRRGNVMGVQFHPEKSHHFGTRLLQNFAEL
jgi:glutamine amidotransferase